MSRNNNTVQYSTPILGLLGIVFVTLKLLEKIDWSWWWVTAPFWIPFAIFAAMMLFVLFLAGLAKFL